VVADVAEAPLRKPTRNLTLLGFVSIVLSLVPVWTYGIGAILGVVQLVLAVVLHRRGYQVRAVRITGVVCLLLSALSGGACWWFVLRPAEATGAEATHQEHVEQRFDKAFDQATEAPPPRRSSHEATTARDGGTGFGDDAGAARGTP
jgi:hypothetical protein